MQTPISTLREARISSTAPLAALLLLATVFACSKDEKKEPGAAEQTEQAPAALENGLTAEQSEKVLAKIGDTTITLGQFADRLASQSPYLRARYNSVERKREFLDNLVRFELLALEARKRGLDKEPDVQRVRRQMMVQQMMKELFDEKGVKLSDISEAEIKAYYDSHQEEFNKPEQRRASHILCKQKAACEALLKQLTTNTSKDKDDMDLFRKLAVQHTQDEEGKEHKGDLRFFSKQAEEGEKWPPQAVRDAAFSLEKTGQLYPSVVQSEAGFHVVKLTGQRPAMTRSLEDARRLIQNRLWRTKRESAIEEFVADLRKKAEVKENLDLLSKVKIDLDAPAGQEFVEPKGAEKAEGAGEAQAPAKQGEP